MFVGTGDRYVTIARSDLAAAISSALAEEVETVFGDTVEAIHDDGAACTSRSRSGARREFDLVVGADGLHSRVRRLAFGPQERFEDHLGIVVAAFEVEGYRPRDELVALMHADVGFQLLRLSLRDDVTMFCITLRDPGDVRLDRPADQQELLRRKLARVRLGGASDPRRHGARPHLLLRPGEPDPHAVLEHGPGGPGRRRRGLPLLTGRAGVRAWR